ncbi:MAG: alanine:cation symporter family protein [Myxococcota bacterium]
MHRRSPSPRASSRCSKPFIDTIIVCSITALVITTGVDASALGTGAVSGVELTSDAFAQVVSWFPPVLSVVVFLFAYSTLISWSYYGREGRHLADPRGACAKPSISSTAPARS